MKGIYIITLGDGTQYEYHMDGVNNSYVTRRQDGEVKANIKILSQDYERVCKALEKEVKRR